MLRDEFTGGTFCRWSPQQPLQIHTKIVCDHEIDKKVDKSKMFFLIFFFSSSKFLLIEIIIRFLINILENCNTLVKINKDKYGFLF